MAGPRINGKEDDCPLFIRKNLSRSDISAATGRTSDDIAAVQGVRLRSASGSVDALRKKTVATREGGILRAEENLWRK